MKILKVSHCLVLSFLGFSSFIFLMLLKLAIGQKRYPKDPTG